MPRLTVTETLGVLQGILFRQKIATKLSARVEHAHPARVVGDEEVPTLVDGNTSRISQHSAHGFSIAADVVDDGAVANDLTRGELEISRSVKDLDAPVGAVGDVDPVLRIDGEVVGVPQLLLVSATGAEGFQTPPFRAKYENTVVEDITDHDLTFAGDGHATRPAEHSFAHFGDCGLGLQRDDLDSLSSAVGDDEVLIFGQCHPERLDLTVKDGLNGTAVRAVQEQQSVVSEVAVVVLCDDSDASLVHHDGGTGDRTVLDVSFRPFVFPSLERSSQNGSPAGPDLRRLVPLNFRLWRQ